MDDDHELEIDTDDLKEPEGMGPLDELGLGDPEKEEDVGAEWPREEEE